MHIDSKRIYIISLGTLAALLLAFIAPFGGGRIPAALLLLPLAAISVLQIKKRRIPSLYSPQVLLIMGTSGVVYVVLYYLSALHFGFTKTGYYLNADVIFNLTLPIAVIIAATELIRYILMAQKARGAKVIAYLIGLISELIIITGTIHFATYATFMDLIGIGLVPGIVSGILYCYLCTGYGFLPTLVFRLLTTWVFYLIPYGSAVPDSLVSFINLMIPIALYSFVSSMYEKKRRYALGKGNRFTKAMSIALTTIVIILMTCTVMLISNQFKYGARVIATESMTGELNKGDVAIIERYEGKALKEGDVIAFEKDGSVFIHRIAKTEIINGTIRFYTMGDANEDLDPGFITTSSIIGTVDLKIAYVGYPSLWLRSLFNKKG